MDSGDDDEEVEHAKKTRVDRGDSRKELLYAGKRGAKRNHDDDQSTDKDEQRLDKRARKFSGTRSALPVDADGSMEVDQDEEMSYQDEEEEEDELSSSAYPPPTLGRGRKRDRAEAGSTFGVDEDESVQDLSEASGSRSQSRVKGRRKRHHAEDNVSSRSSSRRVSKYTRRRRRAEDEDEDEDMETLDADSHDLDSDTDMSVAPETPGRRREGEEWEVGGVRYKMGSGGERMRQALVRAERSRFVMVRSHSPFSIRKKIYSRTFQPTDSVHPDTHENLHVYVETWLTEEEFEDAKERQALAWQDGVSGGAAGGNERGDVEVGAGFFSSMLPFISGEK